MTKSYKKNISFFKTMPKYLFTYVLIGLLIRLILMPFSLHVDERFTGDIVAINEYAHLLTFEPTSSLRVIPLYPPLAYYTAVFFQVLFSGITPPIPLDIFGSQATATWLAGAGIFRQLFFFKFWYLIFDLGAAYLLWRIFQDDQRKARSVLAFWMFNPIIIYNAYFHGQFDVLPIFFGVLGLYFAKKERFYYGILFIGIAACYKNYPFFFLLPSILIFSRSWTKRIKMFFLGVVPYIILIFPFLTEYFRGVPGYSTSFFKVGYDLGFGGQVYLFFALYAFLLWQIEHTRAQGFKAFWQASFVTLLIYFPFSYFDLHYYAWLIPFAALYLVENPRALEMYLFIFLSLLVCLFQTPVGRFLAPISPHYFLRLPSMMEILSPHLPILLIMNIFRSFLAGTLLWLAWQVFKGIKKPESVEPF